jgi:hypothetical protein
MHINAGWLFASLVVSAIGFVLLHYGRKMARVPHLLAGVALLALAVRLGW